MENSTSFKEGLYIQTEGLGNESVKMRNQGGRENKPPKVHPLGSAAQVSFLGLYSRWQNLRFKLQHLNCPFPKSLSTNIGEKGKEVPT